MTTTPHWVTDGLKLNALEHCDIGWHVNLTEGTPLTKAKSLTQNGQFLSLPQLMQRAFTRQLNQRELYEELDAQLSAFKEVAGHTPDFIDGHQHIHHLPMIKNQLLKLYQEKCAQHQTYIRLTHPSLSSVFKTIQSPKSTIIGLTGGRSFPRLLKNRSIPHNSSFSGIYNFAQSHQYRRYFKDFLQASTTKGLIMCHPGNGSQGNQSEDHDPMGHSRYNEYQYFNSDDFINDCDKAVVSIVPLHPRHEALA